MSWLPYYEIRVDGAIGPVVASIFPEFDVTVSADASTISGTVAAAADLLRIFAVLRRHGLTPIDTLVTSAPIANTATLPARSPQSSTRDRRMISRGNFEATASDMPITSKPTRSNIARVPTNAIVVSILPRGSTGYASTAGAPRDAA